jgi:hypothetical protein
MRKFSSYGPIDTELHYYVPRQPLIDSAVNRLAGEEPTRGGHYITVCRRGNEANAGFCNRLCGNCAVIRPMPALMC